MTRGSRRKRPRRFWCRWRRNQYSPKLSDAEDKTVLLVEASAPLRFSNSYSTSCELQGRGEKRALKVEISARRRPAYAGSVVLVLISGSFCSATLPKFLLCELRITGKAQRAL